MGPEPITGDSDFSPGYERDEERYEHNEELFRILEYSRVIASYLDKNPQHVPTEEEERILSEGASAREQLVMENMGLVIQAVNRIPYRRRVEVTEDLDQAGTVGLLRAINTFDVSLGYTLTTHAKHTIRQEITLALQEEYSPIKLPIDMRRDLRAIHHAFTHHQQHNGRAPTIKELAVATGFSIKKVTHLEQIKRDLRTVSLDRPLAPNSTTTIGDVVPESRHTYKQQRIHGLVQEALDQLPERDREIVVARLGLESDTPDLRSLGDRFDLSHEAIRKIQKKGLERIKYKLATEFDFTEAVGKGVKAIRAHTKGRLSPKSLDVDNSIFDERLSTLDERYRELIWIFFDNKTGAQKLTPSEFAKVDPDGRTARTLSTYLTHIRQVVGVLDKSQAPKN